MDAKTTKKGAVKGTVAAAAGVAVLLGGMGTFALWNQSGDIGTTGTGTGHLTATFQPMTWQDETPGGSAHVVVPADFKMVPGDKLVGTAEVEVSVLGDNIVVKPALTGAEGDTLTFLTDSKLTVTTTLENTDGTAVTELDAGDYTLDAKVTIDYAEAGTNGVANANMDETIDLESVQFVLQQDTPVNLPVS